MAQAPSRCRPVPRPWRTVQRLSRRGSCASLRPGTATGSPHRRFSFYREEINHGW